MKTAPAALLNLIPNPKTINARATFRTMRPQFAVSAISGGTLSVDDKMIDSCAYGTGILRVANYNNYLYTQQVTDVHAASWPSWTNTGIALVAGSRPGVDDGYVWYQKSTAAGNLYYRDFGNWTTEVIGRSDGDGTAEFLAPISNERCYSLAVYGDTYRFNLGTIVPSSTHWFQSDATLYDVDFANIDAVNISDDGITAHDNIYFVDRTTGRVSEMRVYYQIDGEVVTWGKSRPVISIDAIDENHGFHLHGAEMIDGKVVLSGRLSRSSDSDTVSMDVYMFGPEDFTLGRDMFISQINVGGKIMVVGTELVACGATYWAVAGGTNLFGIDSAAHKLVTSDIESVQLKEAENRSSTAVLSLSPALSHTAIRRGGHVEVEVAYNSNWMTVLTGEIDRVVRTNGVGESLVVYLTHQSAKRLSQWAPDQGVYIPSQAPLYASASDMSQVIRADGKFLPVTTGLQAGKYDDDDSGWTYSGTWTTPADAAAYGGSVHDNAYTDDGYATFDFVGTRVEFFFTKDYNHGVYDIWVDDVLLTTIDAYSATKTQTSYVSPQLDPGEHTFKVSHGTGSDGYLEVDAIEISGSPEADGAPLEPDEYNKLCVLYTTARASRGGIIRAKFWNESSTDLTTRNPRFGVGLNYYRESKAEAALRLGIDYSDVDDDDCGHNGIVAIYSRDEANGNPGVVLYKWENSELTKIFTRGITLSTNKYVWLQMRFHDGQIEVYWKEDGSTSWTYVVRTAWDYTIEGDPWSQEEGGRGCVVMEKRLMKSENAYNISSDDLIVGVDDHADFPTSGNILIEDEVISYSGKSSATPTTTTEDWIALAIVDWFKVDNSIASAGQVFMVGAPTGNSVTTTDAYAGLAAAWLDADDATDMGLGVFSGFTGGRTFKVVKYWDPTQKWDPDSWDAGWWYHKGDTAFGSWITADTLARILVFDPDPYIKLGIARDPANEDNVGVFLLLDALYLTERGAQGTTAVYHGNVTAYLCVDIELHVDTIEYYSEDEDIALSDAVRRVVRLAGSDVTERYLVDTTLSSGNGWTITDMTDGKKDFIAEIDLPSTKPTEVIKFGWLFYGNALFSTSSDKGYYVCFEDGWIALYSLSSGALTLVDKFTPTTNKYNAGTFKISVQDNRFAIWMNHRLLSVFHDETFQDESYTYKAFAVHNPSNGTVPDIQIRYSELSDLMADIVVGVRGKGMSILGEMTDNRRVYFRCEPDGSLRFYKTLEDAGTIPDIVISERYEDADGMLSRIRMEGIKVSETVDWDAILEEGNLFETANSMYAETVRDLESESEHYFELRRQRSSIRSLETVFHPALQPGDSGTIDIDGTDVDIGILATDVTFGFSGENFGVEASIEVHEQ